MKIKDKILRPSEFKIRLKEAMTKQRKTQADLVKLTGIPKSAMSQYVSGNFEPKRDRLEKLARALEVSESWLLGYNTPMKPHFNAFGHEENPWEVRMSDAFERLDLDTQIEETKRIEAIANGKKPPAAEDEELSEYLEKLRVDDDYRMMFSLMNGATKEDVAKAVQVVKALLGEE